MAVKRIVPNIAAEGIEAARAFYGAVLGRFAAMDHGWIVTFAADPPTTPQNSAGHAVEYGPALEPWGVTRFYVRDPFGRLVNVLAHT